MDFEILSGSSTLIVVNLSTADQWHTNQAFHGDWTGYEARTTSKSRVNLAYDVIASFYISSYSGNGHRYDIWTGFV